MSCIWKPAGHCTTRTKRLNRLFLWQQILALHFCSQISPRPVTGRGLKHPAARCLGAAVHKVMIRLQEVCLYKITAGWGSLTVKIHLIPSMLRPWTSQMSSTHRSLKTVREVKLACWQHEPSTLQDGWTKPWQWHWHTIAVLTKSFGFGQTHWTPLNAQHKHL